MYTLHRYKIIKLLLQNYAIRVLRVRDVPKLHNYHAVLRNCSLIICCHEKRAKTLRGSRADGDRHYNYGLERFSVRFYFPYWPLRFKAFYWTGEELERFIDSNRFRTISAVNRK